MNPQRLGQLFGSRFSLGIFAAGTLVFAIGAFPTHGLTVGYFATVLAAAGGMGATAVAWEVVRLLRGQGREGLATACCLLVIPMTIFGFLYVVDLVTRVTI